MSILRVIINVRCSSIKKREWSSGNTSIFCSRRPWFKSHSQFLLFISACVHHVSILRVIINVRCNSIKKREWSSGKYFTFLFQTSLVQIPLTVSSFYICLCPSCVHPKGYNTSDAVWLRRVSGLVEILHSPCSRRSGFKSNSQFLLFVSACVHPVYILRVIINVRCSLIKKSEWSSGNTSLCCSRGPCFKCHSQFLLFISACVHNVYILRVIINVICSLITKSEWSSGNTSLSFSRRPWFKSHSQIILCISACVHHVSILRVIINVRCSSIKKREWSSGNTSLFLFKSHSQFLLFISACVHPVYILRVIIRHMQFDYEEWVV